METLKINKNSIKVEHEGMTLLVAKYQDSEGVYFLNENLEKQYAIIEKETFEKVQNEYEEESETKKEFVFHVSVWRADQIKTYTKKVKAYNAKEACEKIEKAYKRIYDYELV